MIDELTSNNSEFTVDIIAAIGAAKKTPANQGGNTSIASSGITLSGTAIPEVRLVQIHPLNAYQS